MLGPTHRAFATTTAVTTVVALSLPHPLITIAVAGLTATVPDMDKHFKVFKHRGITHSIWPVVLLVFLAIRAENPFMTGFAIGYISHIIGDSYSVQGVAWLYPFTGYDVLPNGATYVKNERHFFIKLYKAGSRNLTIYKKGNYGKLFDLPKVPVDPKWIWYMLTFLILVNG